MTRFRRGTSRQAASAMSRRLALLALVLCPLVLARVAPDTLGPTSGPPAKQGQRVLLLAYDLKNGGIARTSRGFLNAVRQLRWQVTIVDGKGNPETVRNALTRTATASNIDGVAFIGGDSKDFHPALARLKAAGKILVGWHADKVAGPNEDLFTNITTDPVVVARTAVEYALATTPGPIGAVILTDPSFAIAMRKTEVIRKTLEHCRRCRVLAIEDVKFSQINQTLPALVLQLNQKYGQRWTHIFAINDIYFDNINFPLYRAGRPDIVSIAAGDGSSLAIRRIRLGLSQQKASVAEPCDQQGWQIADEMNRGFAHRPPSGYVSQPILVTRETLASSRQQEGIESDSSYRTRYLGIWLQQK
jgi:ribose transport system substrate-binding protein